MSIELIVDAPTSSGGTFLPPAAGVHDLGSTSLEWDNLYLGDDGGVYLGADQDNGIYHKSDAYAADAEITGVTEGTEDTLAAAANSLFIFNVLDDGDVMIVVNKAGNSHTAFLADGSTGDTIVMAATGASFDVYVASTKEYEFTASDLDMNSNTLSNIGAAGNDFGAAQLDLASGYIIKGAGTLVLEAVTDLQLDLTGGTHKYNFTQPSYDPSSIAIEAQNSGGTFNFGMHTKDGDGTDGILFNIWGVGTVSSVTNRERLMIGVASNLYRINIDAAGTGTARNFEIQNDATSWMTFVAGGNVQIPNRSLDFDNQGSIINVGASGNDWTQNALTLAGGSSAQALTVQTTGASVDAQIDLKIPESGTGNPEINFIQGSGDGSANNQAYHLHYDDTAAGLKFRTEDADGAGNPGDVLKILDGTNDVQFSGGIATGNTAPATSGIIVGSGVVTVTASVDSGAVADKVGFGRYEIGAGNTVIALSQETAVAADNDETKFSHKMQVRLNGATYYLMLTST